MFIYIEIFEVNGVLIVIILMKNNILYKLLEKVIHSITEIILLLGNILNE